MAEGPELPLEEDELRAREWEWLLWDLALWPPCSDLRPPCSDLWPPCSDLWPPCSDL